MARCCRHLAVFLCVLLMLSLCKALSSNVDDGYGHEDGSFESDSLLKLNNDDVLSLISSDETTLEASTVSVSNFGAKGDGKTDDTQAFKKAWKKACSTNGVTTFLVPKGKTYLLKSTRFRGPCKSLRNFQILGTLSASTKRSDYKDKNHWLILEDVNNLSIDGGSTGIINGNGKTWWQNSCKIDKSKPCTKAPTALTLYNLKNLNVKNLRVKNAQQIQISIEKCNKVEVSNVEITAPGDSPNTDGIHITNTQNIRVSNSDIGTGDDCISIEDGTQNLQIFDLTCGPGHGISIGSLGDDNSKAYVSGINVDGAKFSESDNGVRIKTYQGGSGTAKNIKFQNIRMENVKNPIIIDQDYCDKDKCEDQESAVQVKNVVYKNISGTSATDVAITLNCSEKYPCQGIVLENVKIKGGTASCKNANVKNQGTVSPKCS
ncbi:endo-polygalacturonase [Arabidopsis thaliana]|uniref:Polygalacturonase ADPG1 n=4 Tax=Arabidopsis TaxID=3701 RepID=ADPG1_ARATH|nr:Pectin lyase-like superfamily protein [Arabidopsis thaliana]O23147.1 RecName: Full=Polygalacturonase ADPG1; Short=AtADPG1; Short=PG ADPG1; AltName: Full=Pectinase ADPG1; AltName: Full=Protein ARABIDOPSIS DEHISCENCE ZONE POLYGALACTURONASE 1; Flags: Precursor [Arabidopsis thaliana]KAG7628861.1 Glycoside hydrolase family 28 [Arabidopsis thaliana x Arabidopsis arenosa]KAG7634776.1 Glycoside hydrolase family 28 [Arabidopsis suecica]AAC98923.1 endo-polygalacturonase [Arabidopsis thaliana]AAO63440|eukprot:NP_191310.1 Pectin lyase-like superfamily protein [Arabidopsis thaliana]